MLFAQRLLADVAGALEQRFGLAVAPLRIIERGKVVETGDGITMLAAQRFLADVAGALEQRFGLTIVVRFLQADAKPVHYEHIISLYLVSPLKLNNCFIVSALLIKRLPKGEGDIC